MTSINKNRLNFSVQQQESILGGWMGLNNIFIHEGASKQFRDIYQQTSPETAECIARDVKREVAIPLVRFLQRLQAAKKKS